MRKAFKNDKIKFYIGDVRDLQSVKKLLWGRLHISCRCFKAGAPVSFPLWKRSRLTLGTDNVLTAAIAEGQEGDLPFHR